MLVLSLLAARGIPAPVLHHHIEVGTRLVAEVDLAWPDRWLAVELQGQHHRKDPAVWEADQLKVVELQGLGWAVVPFSWRTYMDRRELDVDADRRRSARRNRHLPVLVMSAAARGALTSQTGVEGDRPRRARRLGPGAVGGAGADGVLVEALAEVQALEHELDGGGHDGGRLVAAGELGDRPRSAGCCSSSARTPRR